MQEEMPDSIYVAENNKCVCVNTRCEAGLVWLLFHPYNVTMGAPTLEGPLSQMSGTMLHPFPSRAQTSRTSDGSLLSCSPGLSADIARSWEVCHMQDSKGKFKLLQNDRTLYTP